ncbi:TadE family protein [Nocardioides antri]|uniref:Pilus assembly protein n=1 Tax=Nocardioides antri TaxID=2607659 RepID=A0A5B1M391_9ACTN|nr:TadE family protein [Nocardioides antri]KAA1427201.1 pilus assembly protein [Nocardioides antri]
MAVEVVVLAPVLFMFALLVVAGGRYVSVEGDIEAAARDAARAASFEDSRAAAAQAAYDTYQASRDASLGDADCTFAYDDSDYGPDGTLYVTLRCKVPYDDLGLIGLGGTVTVDADSQVRLDPYRRFE